MTRLRVSLNKGQITGMAHSRFSFEEMLDLRGNTAVYMLYAHARIASIIRKAGKDVAALAATAHISLDHPCEARTCSLDGTLPPIHEAISHALPSSTAPWCTCKILRAPAVPACASRCACRPVGILQRKNPLSLYHLVMHSLQAVA